MNGPLAEAHWITTRRVQVFNAAQDWWRDVRPRKLNLAERPSNVPWPMTQPQFARGLATSLVTTSSKRRKSSSAFLVLADDGQLKPPGRASFHSRRSC